MNLAKTTSMETALNLGHEVYVVYSELTKEIVSWFVFGEKMARLDAETRCNRHGPDTYNYTVWDKYVFIRDRHDRHIKQLEEIERRL